MSYWSTLTELKTDQDAFIKLMHCLSGIYFWEFFTSLDFDWSFISGKRKFQWPMIFYFANRYCLLSALIGVLVALDAETFPLNCQALYAFNQLAGDAALGLASINLSIRTMAFWSHNKYIVVPLVLIIFGHWSLILQGVLLKAEWFPVFGCTITKTNNAILAATFIYSMCFDAIVLTLSAIKLYGRTKHSQLVSLLFKDGLIYFMVAFAANLTAATFMLLSLNAIMSIIFNVPATIASTIGACRAVRRLTTFQHQGPEIYVASNNSGQPGVIAFCPMGNQNSSEYARPWSTYKKRCGSGVHLEVRPYSVTDDQHFPAYAAEGEHKHPAVDVESGTSDDSEPPVGYRTETL